MHPLLRPPPAATVRPTLPRLLGKGAAPSPRGGAAAGQQGEGAPIRRAWPSKQQQQQQRQPAGQTAAAPSPGERLKHALRGALGAPLPPAAPSGDAAIPARHAAPPKAPPSISPEVSLGALSGGSSAAWLPPLPALHSKGEEEDAVLIGSVAPSFSMPRNAGPDAAPSASCAAKLQEAALPQRASFLSSHLGSDDMSLAALAAASRRGTWHSSTPGSTRSGGSGPPTAGSGAAAGGGGESSSAPASHQQSMEEDAGYASDSFEPESPGACGDPAPSPLPPPPAPAAATARPEAGQESGAQPQQERERARLSSGELDVLRQSLLELQLPALGSALPAAASSQQDGEIPDQVVLQELSSRLHRLDSAKRRVLLQVLAKIDGMAGSGEAPAAPPAACGQVRTSGDGVAQPAAVQGTSAVQAAEAAVQAAAPAQPRAPAVAAGQLPAQPQSPSKSNLLTRLASLRKGRASPASSKASSGDGGASQTNSHLAQSPAAPACAQLASQAAAETQAATAPSACSAPGPSSNGTQPQRVQPQLPGGGGDQRGHGSSAGGDALAAFEQEVEHSLAASPTVLALGALMHQPDALDAGLDAAAARPAQHARRSSSGGSSGAAFAIPRCPAGRVLEVRIRSTWGDTNYVGLAGLELFDAQGRLVPIRWAGWACRYMHGLQGRVLSSMHTWFP